MYKRGCLQLVRELIITPEIFDALADTFEIIRTIETDDDPTTVIAVVEHDELLELNEGDYMPFYEVEFERNENGEITLSRISNPYIHTKYFIQCQNQKEPPPQEREEEPLIWLPE